MSFFRSEALAGVRRWREAVVAALVVVWGLWWLATGLGFLRVFGGVLVLGGGALGWAAVQRARFRGGQGGLGVVEVDERQITYLAPVGGGFAAMELLTEVAIGPDLAGLPVWRLRSGREILTIPTSAAGTEALFDVITALPGANIEAAIRASRARPHDTIVIWRRGPVRVH